MVIWWFAIVVVSGARILLVVVAVVKGLPFVAGGDACSLLVVMAVVN